MGSFRRRSVPVVLAAALCLTAAFGVSSWWSRPRPPGATAPRPVPTGSALTPYPDPALPTFPDPAAPGTASRVFLDPSAFDDGVFPAAAGHTEGLADASTLADYRHAIAGRVAHARARLDARSGPLLDAPPPTPARRAAAVGLCREYAFLAL